MDKAIDLHRARAAKARLLKDVGERTWMRGIGLARDGRSWVVRLNVARSALRRGEAIPTSIDGVPISIVFVEGYEKRDLS
jgi:hypothetical protein